MDKMTMMRASGLLGLGLALALLWAEVMDNPARGPLAVAVAAYTLLSAVLFFAWWRPLPEYRLWARAIYVVVGLVGVSLLAGLLTELLHY